MRTSTYRGFAIVVLGWRCLFVCWLRPPPAHNPKFSKFLPSFPSPPQHRHQTELVRYFPSKWKYCIPSPPPRAPTATFSPRCGRPSPVPHQTPLSMSSSATPYAALSPPDHPPPRSHGVGGIGLGLVAGVGLTLAAMGLRTSATPQAAPVVMMSLGSQQPSVGGDCQCSSSSGAVCCCCSHCGCDTSAAPPSNTSHEHGGNWDIDVGAPGVAGGGFCQSNENCVCCSSCDCTGPGSSVVNSTISVSGDCNSVGGGTSCNGDLPARRLLADGTSAHQLSERVRHDARLRVSRHTAGQTTRVGAAP